MYAYSYAYKYSYIYNTSTYIHQMVPLFAWGRSRVLDIHQNHEANARGQDQVSIVFGCTCVFEIEFSLGFVCERELQRCAHANADRLCLTAHRHLTKDVCVCVCVCVCACACAYVCMCV